MIVSIKPLEPLMFRGPGEFDPSSRGVYSYATTLLLPSPSTIAGILGWVINSSSSSTCDDWVCEYKRFLGNIKIGIIALRVRNGDKYKYYFEDLVHRVFLSHDDVRNYALQVRNFFEANSLEELKKASLEIEKIIVNARKRMKEVVELERRIGIGLKVRKGGDKVADEDEGLIYTAEYIMYKNDAEIVVQLNGELQEREEIVKIGGEGRVAQLKILNEDLLKNLEDIGLISKSSRVLYVVTPILFKTGDKKLESALEKSEIDLECNGLKIEKGNIYGKVDLLGVGYSTKANIRMPIYAAILPGSVIVANKEINQSVLSCGCGSEIGYGQIIPINVNLENKVR